MPGFFNQLKGTGRTLGTWQLADAAQLDKHNGKLGTAGTRLIMMLDPMEKAYYWLMHAHTRDSPHYFGYGFYRHRRREQAILVHNAVAGRLRKAAAGAPLARRHMYSFITTLRDISNAFPSTSHASLNASIAKSMDPWTALQLRGRHEQLHVRITTLAGKGVGHAA